MEESSVLLGQPANGYITWKQFFVIVLPMYFATASFPILVTMWLMGNHEDRPHRNAITYREFSDLKEDIKEIKSDLKKLTTKEK